jgi:quinol-cytochrome oxidoreductase complex cytochrome b subunit
VLLKFVYEPTPVAAYASIQSLILEVPFGRWIRNVHHWCAHLLVLLVFLHMLRVFFTGAFHPPRQFNWVIGLGLFGSVLTANFTGYLLPWDQLAYWAVTVSTGMLEYVPWIGYPLQNVIRGGTDIGPATLRIFFAIHTAVVPTLLFLLMAFHFWRVRKAGGVVIPRAPEEAPVEHPVRVPSLPNLLLREVTAATVLIAVVLLFSVFVDAPLSEPANPGLSPNPVKAPWYFAGLQELLLHLHPMFAVCLIPLVFSIALVATPYLQYETNTAGVWFASGAGRRTGIVATATALVLTPALLLFDEWVLKAGKKVSGIPSLIGSGLIPVGVILVAGAVFCWLLRRRFSAARNESVQAVFILLATALVVLTVVGVWFRGEGMRLTWP